MLSNLAFLSNIRRVNQEEVGSGSESVNGFLNGFLDGFEFGGQIYPSAAPNARMAETVTDLASFPILGRNMVYRRCEVTLSSAYESRAPGGHTFGSDPDSIPLSSSSVDSFASLLLGTVSLTGQLRSCRHHYSR